MPRTLPQKLRLFSWQDHKTALWWLGIIYRRSTLLEEKSEAVSRWKIAPTILRLVWHALPWTLLLTICGRFLLFGIFDLPLKNSVIDQTLWWHVKQVILTLTGSISSGVILGIIIGVTVEVTDGVGVGVTTGIIIGVGFGITFGAVSGVALGVTLGFGLGVYMGVLLGLPHANSFSTTGRVGVGVAFGVAFGVTAGVAAGVAAGAAFGVALTRTYYHFVSWIFVWPKLRPQWYPIHPVSWDDLIGVPFWRMDKLLVGYAEIEPQKGQEEIERLIDTYPSQRPAALRAKTMLLARESTKIGCLSHLPEVLGQLPHGDKGYLEQTPKIQRLVREIAQRKERLDTVNRPLFREPLAQALVNSVEEFRGKVAGFREPLQSEFRAASAVWLKKAKAELSSVRDALAEAPQQQLFRAGDPVDRNNEAFVARLPVVEQLEQQIMLATGCPGLVLYARRRMGKTTLLRNLGGFLPDNILTLQFSMQKPALQASLNSFCNEIQNGAFTRLGQPDNRQESTSLTQFYQQLGKLNEQLQTADRRLLLGIDEYENIDKKIAEGVFSLDLLDTIRESIQNHRQITWIFAGSHEITELSGAQWTSYLVSARTIEVPFFSEAESRLLLTDPLKHSPLWKPNDPNRPKFSVDFWGENGIERIHKDGGGWPHLLQLIAETLIDQINNTQSSAVTPELYQDALDTAIVRGHNVLYQLLQGECQLPGEWEYLSAFRDSEFLAPPKDRAVLRAIKHRKLILEKDGQWSLRVPLMRRWLVGRG